MIILYLSITLIIFIAIKAFLYIFSLRYGKISYDGFTIAGFSYDSEKDVFYSTKDAWQKDFGYGHIYDVSAPIVRIIVDTEPIRFSYNNKNWLITFWKGQYGITTGAEIGIYSTEDEKVNTQTIYGPVNQNEMIQMHFKLYKKETLIIDIDSVHWWLAAFKLGMFSNPKELSMEIQLDFPNFDMLKAFVTAFKKVGYKEKDFTIQENSFTFLYKKPHSRQVYTRTFITDCFTQRLNKKNVDLYNKYANDLIETDRIDDSLEKNNKKRLLLNELFPNFLKGPIHDIKITPNIISTKNVKIVEKKLENLNQDSLVNINIYEPIKKDKRFNCHEK